ncbi:helix-turn-helix domain-containing protein [Thalassiella azotivora]
MAALKVSDLKVSELGAYLREQRQSAKLSLRQLADVAGVSNPYLSQVERGLRKPSAEVLQQIAKGLRISAEALYVRAGILEERGDVVEVEAVLLADPHLTDRQRRVLVDLYQTFRAENVRDEDVTPDPQVTAAVAAAAAASTPQRATRKRAATTKAAAKKPPATRSASTQAAKKATATKTTTKRAAPKKAAKKTTATSSTRATRASSTAESTPTSPDAPATPAAQDQTTRTEA